MAFYSISSINGVEEECLDPSHETNLTATNQYDVDGVCREAIKRSASGQVPVRPGQWKQHYTATEERRNSKRAKEVMGAGGIFTEIYLAPAS